MEKNTSDSKLTDSNELHARNEGAVFGRDIADFVKNWQGPATVATMAGYIASKQGLPIGSTQLSVGIAMVAAGVVAEALSLKKQHPELEKKGLSRKLLSQWTQSIQGPSHVSLVVGLVGTLKRIKGCEAAFIAGSVGAVMNMASLANDSHPPYAQGQAIS